MSTVDDTPSYALTSKSSANNDSPQCHFCRNQSGTKIWNIPHRNVFISCCEFFTPGYVSYFWNSESSNEQKKIAHYKKIGIAPYFKNLLLHLLQVILNPSYFTVIFDELLNNFFRKEQMRFNLLGWGIYVSSH